jgi:hypothetical protein
MHMEQIVLTVTTVTQICFLHLTLSFKTCILRVMREGDYLNVTEETLIEIVVPHSSKHNEHGTVWGTKL